MGLFDKVKSILFEEEEVIEPVQAPVEKVRISDEVEYRKVSDAPAPVKEAPKFEKVEVEEFSERDLFKSDSTFKFPQFDEEEFNTSIPSAHKRESENEYRRSNVIEHERRKKEESRSNSLRSDIYKPRDEVKEERRRFKPSPTISPVYGILDKDYKAEDIKEAPKNVNHNIITSKDLDVDSVRAKAFGKLEDDIENSIRKTTITTETYEIIKDNTDSVIEESKTETIKIEKPISIADDKRIIEERSKAIDELLNSASDKVINVEDEKVEEVKVEEVKEESNADFIASLEEEIDEIKDSFSDNDIDEEINDKVISDSDEEDDVMENDLYDLIDSMYDNNEDGE